MRLYSLALGWYLELSCACAHLIHERVDVFLGSVLGSSVQRRLRFAWEGDAIEGLDMASDRSSPTRPRVAWVVPRYGMEIGGGAEELCRRAVEPDRLSDPGLPAYEKPVRPATRRLAA
jgi:hypothetical protein